MSHEYLYTTGNRLPPQGQFNNGLFQENSRFVCKSFGSEYVNREQKHKHFNGEESTFCGKRHYGRRKQRKLKQNAQLSLEREKKDMNGKVQYGDKFIPHPPDKPKSPINRSNNMDLDNRALPPIRGGKLPPLGGRDQNHWNDETSDSLAINKDARKSSLNSLEPLKGVAKPDSNQPPLSESSSEEETDEDSRSVQSHTSSEKKEQDYAPDETDGIAVKNPFKGHKRQKKVLSKQKQSTAETDSGGKVTATSYKPKAKEADVLQSYEDYMREMTSKEDEDVSSDGSDEYTVSSLSGSDSDTNDYENVSTDINVHKKTRSSPLLNRSTMSEGLYSIPMKKINKTKKVGDNESLQNTLGFSSQFLGLQNTAENSYMTMSNFQLLRSLSDPNLRRNSQGQLKVLKSHTYLTPVDKDFIQQLYEANNALARPCSNSSLDSQGQGARFRPLPPIPSGKDASANDDEEPLYETINTCPSCRMRQRKQFMSSRESSTDSVTKSKLSFKTVASTVISVMPRLTTQEARSRKLDRALADIRQYLPDNKLRIFLGTWNMKGTKVLPERLDDFLLPQESVYLQDIYAIGTQEGTPFRREWELRLQETLGPSHVLIHSCNFGVLQLSIFVRREIIWYCTGVEQDSVATRMGHQIKTKGALAVSFTVFGTSFLFINSHFTSDEGKMKDRVSDYRNICKSLTMSMEGTKEAKDDDVTTKFDRVFWFGDFNFRVKKSRPDVDKVLTKHIGKPQQILKELLPHDQLLDILHKGKIFTGFSEHPIKFMPTYKFDVNTDNYDTSTKRRVPSWTDRVLMRTARPEQIEVIAYNSCDTIKNSDHRPVHCVVQAAIEPIKSKYTIPGGRFDRDLYVEANLRRNAPSGSQAASNVCTIL